MVKRIERIFTEQGNHGHIRHIEDSHSIALIGEWKLKRVKFQGHKNSEMIFGIKGIAYEPIYIGDKVIVELGNYDNVRCIVTDIDMWFLTTKGIYELISVNLHVI